VLGRIETQGLARVAAAAVGALTGGAPVLLALTPTATPTRAATLTRDLVITQTRALKLPGWRGPSSASPVRRGTRTGRTRTIFRKCSARSSRPAASP
jgi:hypothetical protein